MCKCVVVAPSFLERIVEHAASTQPNECCGILGGKGNVVTSVHPLTNDLASPDGFFANPAELFQAIRKMRQSREEMIGIYHSHPFGPSQPSTRDREENGYPGLYYFIISLAGNKPETSCFMMTPEGPFSRMTMI